MMRAIKPRCRYLLPAAVLLLSLTCALQVIARQDTPGIYAIQLESSRKPEMRDYEPIRKFGKLYTYREISGKQLRRVRLGYFQSHAQARKILEKIRSMGFKKAYITRIRHHLKSTAETSAQPPAKKIPTTKLQRSSAAEAHLSVRTATTPTHSGHYAIQLESSRHPRLADYESFRQWGTLYIYQRQSGVGLQRVRLGYYDKLENARSVLEKIIHAGFRKAYITRIQQSRRHEKPPPPPLKPVPQAMPEKTAEQKAPSDESNHSPSGNIISTFDYVVPDPFESTP